MTGAAAAGRALRGDTLAPQPGTSDERGFGIALLVVGVVAVVVRWLGYTGFFGSDEVTYVISAFKVLDGDWTLDDYVGANRLGVNLPMAAFAAVFGRNEAGAALYSLSCSVAEVMLVAWLGWRLFGHRAGLFAGLLLATLPTHVHFAGRIMADAPLSLAITGSFAVFFAAERDRWSAGYLLAGVLAGLSFWIKPVTLFVFGILAVYPLVERRFDPRWLWMLPGVLIAMAANGALYAALTGRFWFVFEVIGERRSSGYLEAGTAAGQIHDAAHYYLIFLFGKIYHTGLLGFLAAAGVVAFAWQRRDLPAGERAGVRRVLFWGVGLIVILSLLPASIDPLLLIPKQTNYMLIFVAPLALLAGWAMSRWSARLAWPTLGAAAAVGVVFALLLQSSVAVFRANSGPTLDFVAAHPGGKVVVMSNAYRLAQFRAQFGGVDLGPRLVASNDLDAAAATGSRVVVVDAESAGWDVSSSLPAGADVPACWQPVQELRGEPTGAGAAMVRLLRDATARLPGSAGAAVQARLARLAEPKPARVWRLPPGC